MELTFFSANMIVNQQPSWLCDNCDHNMSAVPNSLINLTFAIAESELLTAFLNKS
jgi:hypothetical protein